eukprot:5605836-Alexandrium_andersonii.AAC.1
MLGSAEGALDSCHDWLASANWSTPSQYYLIGVAKRLQCCYLPPSEHTQQCGCKLRCAISCALLLWVSSAVCVCACAVAAIAPICGRDGCNPVASHGCAGPTTTPTTTTTTPTAA